MRKFLILIAVILSAGCAAQSTLTIKTYCRDTVYLPVSTMTLVAYTTSSDAIIENGWLQIAGPAKITVGSGDSVKISGLMIAGTYLFQYHAVNAKGLCSTGIDMVNVIAVPIPARKAKNIIYDDGTNQVIP